ncbi:hypothetical protein [Actinomadura oligospora]|uniref:hypothetical protein n=1 Tax=Actinomadura oligospora TaxID=111804 RepID=UPI0004AE6334|nr:hypothetical protein [Actinomadura oligospora]
MVAVVALLVVGGIALFNAVNTGDDTKPQQSARASASGGRQHSGGQKASASTPLVIKVVGSSATNVLVTVAGSNHVLAQGQLNPGEGRRIEDAPLNVVASDGGAVQVTICGKVQPRKPSGQRGTWFVDKC